MRFISFLIFIGVSLLARADHKPILIDRLKIEPYTPLKTALRQLDELDEIRLATSYASDSLENNLLPELSLRRVYLQDLLVAFEQLSGTRINMSQKNGAETIHLFIEADPTTLLQNPLPTQDPDISSPDSTPKEIDPNEFHTQVFPVADFIKKDPKYEKASQILRNLDSLLKQQAQLRGELAQRDDPIPQRTNKLKEKFDEQIQQAPFKLELHEATQIILLHAPVAYQITAKAFFDQFGEPNALPKEENKSPDTNAEAEILVMLKNMRDELSEIREKSQRQEETIRELRKVIEQQKL